MQCVSRCVEKVLTMRGADPGSTAESPAFCRFFLILCCLVYLSCQVNRHKTHRWITSVFIDFLETCLGRRSHAEDPPLHEACLPSLSTCNVTDIDIGTNGPPGRVSTNASEHAMLHSMLFAPPSQNTKSVWCMLKHLNTSWACTAMRWLYCLSWGCLWWNYCNVRMGWLVLDLFFLQLVLLFLRKSLILFEFEGPQPLTGELLSHCSCHMPGRCNDRQRCARHDVLFCQHLLFIPWQIRKGTLGRAKLLFQNLWSWFKRPSFCLLLHWYEHPNHKLHAHVLFDTIFKLQYLGISEYSISFKSTVKLFYVTRSNLSHSPEDAVILSPSPNEPFHTCIFLDLIGLSQTSSLHRHLPFTVQQFDEPTQSHWEKTPFSFF